MTLAAKLLPLYEKSWRAEQHAADTAKTAYAPTASGVTQRQLFHAEGSLPSTALYYERMDAKLTAKVCGYDGHK